MAAGSLRGALLHFPGRFRDHRVRRAPLLFLEGRWKLKFKGYFLGEGGREAFIYYFFSFMDCAKF